jgi:ATP-dependent Zn protease
MRRFFKRKIVWIPIVVLLVVALVFSFFRGGETHEDISFAEVVADAQSGKIQSIEITGPSLTVRLRDNTTYSSRAGKDTDVTQVLQNAGVTVGGATPGAVDVSYQDESHPLGAGSSGSAFSL